MRFVPASWGAGKSRWSMSAKRFAVRAAVAAFALAITSGAIYAQTPATPGTPRPTDNYDELFQRYLLEARVAKTTTPEIHAWAWLNALALDHRATNVNDLVTIRVIE